MTKAEFARANARRCELIRRGAELSEPEKVELAALEEQVDAYLDVVAPLPLEFLRQVEKEVRKAVAEPVAAYGEREQ